MIVKKEVHIQKKYLLLTLIFLIPLSLLLIFSHLAKAELRGETEKGCVILTWDPPQRLVTGEEITSNQIDGYNIYRSTIKGKNYTHLNSTLIKDRRYIDNRMDRNVIYYYVINAISRDRKESAYSNEIESIVKFPVLTNLKATVDEKMEKKVFLTWDSYNYSDIKGYNIYKAVSSGGYYPGARIAELVQINAYTDQISICGQNYYYVVTVVDQDGVESGYSNEVGITPACLPPEKRNLLENIKDIRYKIEGDCIILSWNETRTLDIKGYNIYRRDNNTGGEAFTLLNKDGLITTSNYRDCEIEKEITKGNIYYYSVVTVDKNNNESRYPSELRANYKAVIVNVAGGNRPLKPDAKITVLLSADANETEQRAWFDLVGLSSNINMEEIDDRPGEYQGSYQLDKSVNLDEIEVIGYLEDKQGQVLSARSKDKIKIDRALPERPVSLTASLIKGTNKVTLNWEKPKDIDDLDCFHIYYSLKEENNFVQLTRLEKYITEYTDRERLSGKTYIYYLKTSDFAGNLSEPSDQVEIFIPDLNGQGDSIDRTYGDRKPMISSLEAKDIFSGDVLVIGDTLKVTMTGEKKCTGYFNIGAYQTAKESLTLDWSNYEPPQGIKEYRIYKSSYKITSVREFSDPLTVLSSNTKTYTLTLENNVIPYLTVTFVDQNGLERIILTPRIGIKMEDIGDGVYNGSYTISTGDYAKGCNLYAYLLSPQKAISDNSSTKYPLVIDTGTDIQVIPEKRELKADKDNPQKTRVKILLTNKNGKTIPDQKVRLRLFTTSEYSGIQGLGRFDARDYGNIEMGLWGGETDIKGEMEAEYTAGLAAKTVIIRAEDEITGDVDVGYITSYIEAETAITLTKPVMIKALTIGYTMTITASQNWLTADGISKSLLTVSVKDVNNNPVVGRTVNYTINCTMSDCGSIRLDQATTDINGISKATFIAGKKRGTVEIWACINDSDLKICAKTAIELCSDAPAKMEISATPGILEANGRDTSNITVKVMDINDNTNSGFPIVFMIIKADGSLTNDPGYGNIFYSNNKTNSEGICKASYRAGNVGETTVYIRARAISAVPTNEELRKAKTMK
ncbi:MAG: invasin domain 3-containing protein [bacterium]